MAKVLVTKLGGTIRFMDAPEHLAPGFMLALGIDDPKDFRHVEIFLSPENLKELQELLREVVGD